jgi:hypothetical protein
MNRTLHANMLATHFNGLNTGQIIKNRLDSINDTLNPRGEFKLSFLKLFFNAHKTHLGKRYRHTANELKKVIKKINLLNNNELQEVIGWMEEENSKSKQPLNFCHSCNREDEINLIPYGIYNVFNPDGRLSKRRKETA